MKKGSGTFFCLQEVLRLRQQQTPQWGVRATERSALADGGASPRQVLRKDYSEQ